MLRIFFGAKAPQENNFDEYEYGLYYCEANSYCSNTVGSYLYTSDRKYRLEQQRIQLNADHRFANCSGIKWYI